MIHKTKIDKYSGSLQELAEEVGNLRYDALEAFLRALSEKISKDGEKDHQRARYKLASHLASCAHALDQAREAIKAAWIICKPYTQE